MARRVAILLAICCASVVSCYADEIGEALKRAGIDDASVTESPADLPLSADALNRAIERETERLRAQEGRDAPVPEHSEVAMAPRTQITADTPAGVIRITSGKGLQRSYTWEGATRSVEMVPRAERWYGSLGLYYPGPGDHWKEHKGITRGVVDEGQMQFKSVEKALKWIENQKSVMYFGRPFLQFVYRNDGLMVGWSKTPERNQLNVEVWQIMIDGKKPTELKGSEDDKIVVESLDKKAE